MEENKKPLNPPAFPSGKKWKIEQQGFSPIEKSESSLDKGMTLRDYFGSKAMQASISDDSLIQLTYEERSDFAYRQADAMLKQREL